jgi:Zn-dependent M28 family amino/carboxypeptidase
MNKDRSMRWDFPSLWLTLAALVSTGCSVDAAGRGLDAITAEGFDAHLGFLASDFLEGRAPGSRGAELAALYIATQFELAGLNPIVGDSSFLQPVPLVAVSSQPELAFRARGGASFEAAYGPEFVAWSSRPDEPTQIVAELVFVGYGISAPEAGWDDYKDVDVSGKVLLMLLNDPGPGTPGRFRGDTLTYYGTPDYKYEEAARRGAVGAIVIHTRDLAGYGWHLVESVRNREQLQLEPAQGAPRPEFQGMMSRSASETIVPMAGLDFATLLESATSENFRPIPTGLTVSASVRSEVRSLVDANVAGLLPGGDPELAGEVVVFTSHFDNLGIGPIVDTDSLYNGAYDNASGTAMLILLARAFGRLPERPARSVLFLAVTAEQPDLLGSGYYVENPLVPLELTVANINLDGVNLWGPTQDIVAIAGRASSLEEAVVRAAAAEDLRLEGDWAPEQGHLYGSGQFNFMKADVPAVHIGHGLDFIGQMPGWGARMMSDYRENNYRQPSDEYRPGTDLRGAVQQGRVAFRVGLAVANARERPSWKEELRSGN